GRFGQGIGVLAIVYLVARLVMLLVHVNLPDPKVALAAPPAVHSAMGGAHAWGSIAAVGTDLFGAGLFPFEAISILLLVAVVGAIAIARPLRDDAQTTDDAEPSAQGGH